jgi:hypothetical protein
VYALYDCMTDLSFVTDPPFDFPDGVGGGVLAMLPSSRLLARSAAETLWKNIWHAGFFYNR